MAVTSGNFTKPRADWQSW